MSRIAFIFRADVHASDKNPSSWKGDYQAEIWSDLESIGQMARDYKVTAVLDAGDYFHVKAPSRNSYTLMYRTVNIHTQYKCPTYSIVGNHDISYNNLDSIDHQPLGLLYACGVFKHLKEEVFRDGDIQVRIVGVPYNSKRTLDDLLAIRKQPGDTYLVAVVHALASEVVSSRTGELFKEPLFGYKDLVSPEGPDLWAFGHGHQDQGVVIIQGKYFVNQGAVSRGALTYENIERTPQVSLLEFTTSGIVVKLLPLTVAPAEEVFDFEKKKREESETHSIDHFIEQLQEDATFDSNATIEDNIRSLDFVVEVRDLALAYLERARVG